MLFLPNMNHHFISYFYCMIVGFAQMLDISKCLCLSKYLFSNLSKSFYIPNLTYFVLFQIECMEVNTYGIRVFLIFIVCLKFIKNQNIIKSDFAPAVLKTLITQNSCMQYLRNKKNLDVLPFLIINNRKLYQPYTINLSLTPILL